MQDILAFANDFREWGRGPRYAAGLAALLDASLTGIYLSEPVPMVGTPIAYPEFYNLVADTAREAAHAEPDFLRLVTTLGVGRAHWQVAEGYVTNALAHAANWHDLLVIESGKNTPWGSTGEVGKILLTCGAPCLIVPETAADTVSLDAIAVAWNGSAESMRAIHDALPLLKRARRVELIYGTRSEPFSSMTWRPPLDIERYLALHEVEFNKHLFSAANDVAGTELLALVRDLRADMLVMGAYGHARISEWMLGGATLQVLANSEIPVFLRH